ncbi:hypothetical protein ASPWEDRAFT_70175 [Aspergillus wentii DTO 134E9]|uniref:Uncharacterized protein n=1 Tax=Aspergillus wentii DTO 134E9 TaxID=1073089 RepID=A0A1L9RI01_ASPWE|nr:uncharacterized protein ASPWEDRAFT_70175 [Aspergillus wentii DTO 134E9]OJJ34493.1 hypothetical protein ASPWEDRAFT_70175 [Aspergillus wentii DTO 134E9]
MFQVYIRYVKEKGIKLPNYKKRKDRYYIIYLGEIRFYKGIIDLESSKSSNKSITKEKKFPTSSSKKKSVRSLNYKGYRSNPFILNQADNREEDDYNNNNSFINDKDKEIKDPLNPKPKGKKEVGHSKSKGKILAKALEDNEGQLEISQYKLLPY